ncbi:stt3 [Symbiodinium sp. CCMP2456]|nr:stt3 [Symbiodinium sp. CCMP2456]
MPGAKRRRDGSLALATTLFARSALLFPFRQAFKAVLILVQILFVLYGAYAAYEIRLYPIKDYGYIIHEFDPWFNYRAAEYLAENGLKKFFQWYDYESWYPLGRPIGTTIYPGMQMTAVWIWEAMKMIGSFKVETPSLVLALRPLLSYLKQSGWKFVPSLKPSYDFSPMSVNDICCMIPPWFGTYASLFTGLLTYEISRSVNAGVCATLIMAIIPAHLMRSVGGEFDNEAVAVTAICSTFWLWILSVRTPKHWPVGLLAGLSYIYMVAAWGGYIFVINMVGIHAAMLVAFGRFNSGVHKAYSIFYVVGVLGAMQIPVVGLQPLRSVEQLGPLMVFMGFQVLAFCDFQRRRQKMQGMEFAIYRAKVVALLIVSTLLVCAALYPTGYFGPISSRIRGLFVKHTKTGNPLVDSVAEHQPANPSMYASYLNLPLDYAVLGGFVCLGRRNNGFLFLCLYGFVAQHFSGKMSRLVLICGPIVSVACGIWCGFVLDQLIEPFLILLGKKGYTPPTPPSEESKAKPPESGKSEAKGKAAAKAELDWTLEEWEEDQRPGGANQLLRIFEGQMRKSQNDGIEAYREIRATMDNNPGVVAGRGVISLVVLLYAVYISSLSVKIPTFIRHCDQVARSLSNPQVVFMSRDRQGNSFIVDDYLKGKILTDPKLLVEAQTPAGYQWIDQNTPKDSRVMAWWDYGYQITGIARRTSIADGNTWNHEHIATLGRTLTSSEKKAHNAIRHMADYVLVWAGGGGDDLAKSPHLARIGNSVFPDHCGDDDPKCNKFSFYADHSPTPMMARSLLYKLCQHNVSPGVKVNEKLFKEVHTTKHGLMRVYQVMNVSQESKDWVCGLWKLMTPQCRNSSLPVCCDVRSWLKKGMRGVCQWGRGVTPTASQVGLGCLGRAEAEARERVSAAQVRAKGGATPLLRKRTRGGPSLLAHLLAPWLAIFQLWRRKPPCRPPRQRHFGFRFRSDLRRRGAAVARIPEALVADLEDLASQTLAAEANAAASVPSSLSAPSFLRAGGLNVAFPDTMSWHWAQNDQGLEAFAAAARIVLKQLGDEWGLVAASFVVAEGGCADSATKFHVDFGPPPIPRGAACTALLPVHPRQFPEDQGNLEILPWDASPGQSCVHRYSRGNAIVFDGKLAHRTQPFATDVFAQRDRGQAPAAASLRGRRILASMSFALWRARAATCEKTLQSRAFWIACDMEQRNVADPKNRIVSMSRLRNFAQIEDFNRKGGKSVRASELGCRREGSVCDGELAALFPNVLWGNLTYARVQKSMAEWGVIFRGLQKGAFCGKRPIRVQVSHRYSRPMLRHDGTGGLCLSEALLVATRADEGGPAILGGCTLEDSLAGLCLKEVGSKGQGGGTALLEAAVRLSLSKRGCYVVTVPLDLKAATFWARGGFQCACGVSYQHPWKAMALEVATHFAGLVTHQFSTLWDFPRFGLPAPTFAVSQLQDCRCALRAPVAREYMLEEREVMSAAGKYEVPSQAYASLARISNLEVLQSFADRRADELADYGVRSPTRQASQHTSGPHLAIE